MQIVIATNEMVDNLENTITKSTFFFCFKNGAYLYKCIVSKMNFFSRDVSVKCGRSSATF